MAAMGYRHSRIAFWSVVACLICSAPAQASVINWVDFTTYTPGAGSSSGLQSADGLELTASFSTLANMRAGFPQNVNVTIDDPRWPFSNNTATTLGILSSTTNQLTTVLTLDFTNPGGLAAGGSIAVVDLELVGSSVQFQGLQNGIEVDVNWDFAFYQTDDVNVAPPIWDASTNTLRGSGDAFPTINNFAFLVSDTQIDSLVLRMNIEPQEGLQIGVSQATVPSSPVPEPSAILTWLSLATAVVAGSRFFNTRLRPRIPSP